MWPELSSSSCDLRKISQCFPVILSVLQRNTHVLRVNSIASRYQWIYCVLWSEKSLFLTPTNYFQSMWQSLQFTPIRYERFTLCCALSSWKRFPEPWKCVFTPASKSLVMLSDKPCKRTIIQIGPNTACCSNSLHPLIKDKNSSGRRLLILKRLSSSS